MEPNGEAPTEKVFEDQEVIRLFETPFTKRTTGQSQKIIKILSQIPKLRTFVNDDTYFQRFLKLFAEFLEYEFIPRGSAVFHFGEPGEEFYVIMKGEADVFIQKSDLDFMNDSQNTSKIRTYYDLHRFFEKYSELEKKVLLNNDLDSIFPPEIKFSDLNAEERLLYCATDHKFDYFQRGICYFKKINSLSSGDSFGEIALIFNKPRAASIIAQTDLYLMKIHRDNYRKIFDLDIKNIETKVAFLSSLFPSVSKQMLARLCYCIQEKPYSLNQKIFIQGARSDTLFIVREGEVKLYSEIEQKATPLHELSTKSQLIKKCMRLNIAILGPGTIFGEEVVNKSEFYTTTAVSASNRTFLYLISKEAFHGVISKVYREVESLIRQNLQLKLAWRDQRVKKLYNAQEKIAAQQHQQLKIKEKEKIASEYVLDHTIKESLKSIPRHECDELFDISEKRIAYLNALPPSNACFEPGKDKKFSRIKSQTQTKTFSEMDIAHTMIKSLILKQKNEEENSDSSSKEFAKMLWKNYKDYPPKIFQMKDSFINSTLWEEQHSSVIQLSAQKSKRIKTDITFIQDDSPTKAVLSRNVASLVTPQVKNKRVTSYNFETKSHQAWNQISEKDLTPIKLNLPRDSKARASIRTFRSISSNETTLPVNRQSIRESEYSSFIDCSANISVKKYFLNPKLDNYSISSHNQASPSRCTRKKLEGTAITHYPIISVNKSLDSLSPPIKQKIKVESSKTNSTRNFISSRHNMFRMKPRKSYLLDKYTAGNSIKSFD